VIICTACGALAQTQTWNPEQRSRSQALVSAGVTQLTKRQWDAAIASLTKATVIDPTDPIAFEMLGLALGGRRRFNEAMDNLQHSYSLQKASETLLSTGIIYYLDHDYPAALDSYRMVGDRLKNSADIAGNVGYAHYRKGDLVKADECFRALIKAHPQWQLGYQGLACVQYLRGQFAASRSTAQHAETLRSYAPVLLLLAKLDMLEGNVPAAVKRVQQYRSKLKKTWQWRPMTELGYPLQRDFKWDPYVADMYDSGTLLLARAHVQVQEPKGKKRSQPQKGGAVEMVGTISDALRDAPDDIMLLRDLGLAQMAAGANEDAVATFTEVLQLCPTCNVDRLHLGKAFSLIGQDREAAEQIAEFQKRSPREKLSSAFTSLLQKKAAPAAPSTSKDPSSGF
jgi:Flp pilus assembly protein TadD